jgi:hypothetical protein
MANRTAWTAGNGASLTWTAAFTGTDLDSLASGSTIMSNETPIANGTNLDIYCDVSIQLAGITSATPGAGSYIGLYLLPLLADGSTYDGYLTPGGAAITRTPAFGLVGTVPIETAVATTFVNGIITGIVIPPGTFAFALYNGFLTEPLSATNTNNVVMYRTYNMKLNN